jgi:FtsH-binding integral membrane protein
MVNTTTYNLLHGVKSMTGGKLFKNSLVFTKDKKELLVKTFALLIVQLGITYYVMIKTPITKEQYDNYQLTFVGLFIGELVIIFLLSWYQFSTFIKLILFTVFSYLWGVMFAYAYNYETTKQAVQIALTGTLGIFSATFLIGLTLLLTGIELSIWFGFMLWIILLLLIITRIIIMFGTTYSLWSKGLAAFSLFLFSLYIMYDTNRLLQRNYYGDFITAALDFYLDILNIFANLLSFNN